MRKDPCIILLALAAALAAPTLLRAQEVLRVQNGAVLTVQSGATLTVNGGITLDNGSKLNHNGSITLQQYGSAGTADWIDNSTTTYGYGSGTTIFNSNATQTVTSPNSFGQITVNNAGLTLGANTTAATWLLTTGVITTNANLLISTSTTALPIHPGADNPGYANAWINGTIRQYITPRDGRQL